jgi:hypothetical protein
LRHPGYIFKAILLIAGMAAMQTVHPETFQIEKNCSPGAFNMKVVSVEVNKSETVVNLKSRRAENHISNTGSINPPGSPTPFYIVNTSNPADKYEIVDIKGAEFGVINKYLADGEYNWNQMVKSKSGSEREGHYRSLVVKAMENTSYLENNMLIGLVFPPIPKSWKSFHLRELPADKSDWICPNIQLPR